MSISKCASHCHQGHVGSKTVLQQNLPVLNWECRLRQIDTCKGCAYVRMSVCGLLINSRWVEMYQVVRRAQWLRCCIDSITRCLLASAQRRLLGRCSKSWVKTAKSLRRIIVVSRSSSYSSCLLVWNHVWLDNLCMLIIDHATSPQKTWHDH